MKRLAICLCGCAMLLAGCGMQTAATPRYEAAEALPCDEAFQAAAYDFTVQLLQHALVTEENGMLSPYSVMEALAMTANGAAGETRTQMETTLGGLPLDRLNGYLNGCRTAQGDALETANGIWVREGVTLEDAFLETAAGYYDASISRAAFTEKTVRQVNQWVKQRTKGMIPKIVDSLDKDDRLLLVNAAAFDAKWEKPYDDTQVKDGIFTSCNGMQSTVTMLHSEEGCYLTDGMAEGFLKPYAGGQYAFVGILPAEEETPVQLLARLDGASLLALLSRQEACTVHAQMPAFTCDADYALDEMLPDMGMADAFSTAADFSGISNSESLKLGKVTHKTHIELDAKGTKAAAVTFVSVMQNGAEDVPENSHFVTLNRPFLYLIVETETLLPVFAGIVEYL